VAVSVPSFAEYVASVTAPDSRVALRHAWEVARAAAPEAVEGASYGMPALKIGTSPVFAVRATATHLSLYPFSPPVLEALADELAGFKRSKGSVQFSAAHPIPDDVVREIVVRRSAEITA
jgi:uncharacterized protein YdhG (YjbR/CyaY superfamily)